MRSPGLDFDIGNLARRRALNISSVVIELQAPADAEAAFIRIKVRLYLLRQALDASIWVGLFSTEHLLTTRGFEGVSGSSRR
jgi:hypothetical protein